MAAQLTWSTTAGWPERSLCQLARDVHYGPAQAAFDPREWSLGRMRLGHRDEPGHRAQPAAVTGPRTPQSRLLHQRATVLEEYYALAVLGKGGIGTPHMDGNTRLCTARPRPLEGILRSRRPARNVHRHRQLRRHLPLRTQRGRNTDSALVTRAYRIAGQNRPRVVCVDPRDTEVARYADVHLAVRPGIISP